MPPKANPSARPSRAGATAAAAPPSASAGSSQLPRIRGPSTTATSALATTRTKPGTAARLQPRTSATRLSSSTAVTRAGAPAYGDLVESDEVHDEIRELGTQVKTMLAQQLPRHGTSQEQVMWGVREFGPSKESRRVLNKENEAARLAWETGIYCVWRCMEKPKLSGANQDFCCRLGYRHVCFCGHPMAAHTTPGCAANSPAAASSSNTSRGPPVSDAKLAVWKGPCEEAGCECARFRYVPNTPLEIGEAWLTRRANWKASEWSAKCRCGHGHKAHDPTSYMRCRSCGGCSGFNSAFLCVVCDLPWEAHETVWESEGMRAKAGLPIQEAFAPLAGIDWDVREAVLTDVTMGGRIEPSATYLALHDTGGTSSTTTTTTAARRVAAKGTGATPSLTQGPPSDQSGEVMDAVLDVEYCPACATIYKSAASKFCTQCGQPRPRRPATLR